MTLDEAIQHCHEKACGNTECSQDHAQLEGWLKELKELKQRMDNVVDGEIVEVEDDSCSMNSHTHLELFVDDEILAENFKDGDEVKVLIIKK